MTSEPERTLSFDMRGDFDLDARKNGRILRESKFSGIFPLEMKRDCFAQVLGKLIEGLGLGDDGQIDAFCDELRFALIDVRLNYPPHIPIV